MSRIEEFFSRIQTDYAFYLLFRNSPEKVLDSFGLSLQERSAVTDLAKADGMDGCAGLSPKMLANTVTNTIHSLVPDAEGTGFDPQAWLARPKISAAITQINAADQPADRRAALRNLIRELR